MINELVKDDVLAISKLLEDEMYTLQPWKCSPSTLVMHIGAVVREYLRGKGVRPSITLLDNGAVYVSRASKLAVEVVFGSICIYIIFPGDIDGSSSSPIERAIQAHHISVKGDLGEIGDWDTYFLAITRQSTSEPPYAGNVKVFDSPLHFCGEYKEGDLEFPSRRLWISAARVNPERGLPILLGL